MGRYITGDLDYKFWFGVQSSDDADFFGVSGAQPNYLSYYYGDNDLPTIVKGVKSCKAALGDELAKLDKFFDEHNGYNDAMLIKAGLDPEDLVWYARLQLGKEIFRCVKKTGHCDFEAEL